MSRNEPSINLFDSTGQPLTKMPDEIRPSTNGAIFNEKGEILLQRRADNGYWGLPGGKVDIGESVEQGAIREVLEETGLHVTIKRLIGVYSDPQHYSIMSYPSAVQNNHLLSRQAIIKHTVQSAPRDLADLPRTFS